MIHNKPVVSKHHLNFDLINNVYSTEYLFLVIHCYAKDVYESISCIGSKQTGTIKLHSVSIVSIAVALCWQLDESAPSELSNKN